MCGIVGLLTTNARKSPAEQIGRASSKLVHRGPDDCGLFLFDPSDKTARLQQGNDRSVELPVASPIPVSIALEHRRLSIIDLSSEAAQPMASPDQRKVLLHNGEIYNYGELRRQLEARGHSFRTSSDSEVLLAGYEEWGPGVLDRAEGMFAFVVLDFDKKSLFLARDPFGIKPLYYFSSDTTFAFASEIAALLEFDEVRRRANPVKVFEHLNYWTTDSTQGTFFSDIRCVPAGHYMEVPLAQTLLPTQKKYWDIPRDVDTRAGFEEAVQHLRGLFMDSMKQHLQSDVPWCVALSGGTDSSSITMAARKLCGESVPIHTVSYVADETHLNEEPWIDTVNLAAKAESHKMRIGAEDLGRDFKCLVRTQGQPMVTAVVYAQSRVFRHAHECGFKVLLEGQGADELLAGYPFYLQARLATLLRTGHWLQAAHFLYSAPPRFLTDRSFVLRHAVERAWPSLLPPRHMSAPVAWISEAWAARTGTLYGAAPASNISGTGRFLRDMICDTVRDTKLPSLLRYGDHNAMAVSVENRVPFLTKGIVEFLFSLPEKFIIGNDGTTKNVFRQAMKGITPEFVLRRKNKIGFEPPYARWMQSMAPQLEAILEDAKGMPVFDAQALTAMQARIGGEGIRDASCANRVWRIASLAQWAREFGVSLD